VEASVHAYTTQHARVLGSSGSRLLSGHSAEAEDLEAHLAHFHGAAGGALLCPSGYMANLALLSCLPGPGDVVLYDAEIHASVHDGVRQSRAGRALAFAHNDLADLDRQMQQALGLMQEQGGGGSVVVVVESVYSMSGDLAPLTGLADLLSRHPCACLIVDEAHATGPCGWEGRGRLAELGLESLPLVRVVTLGKGLGVEGGLLLFAHPLVKSYLLNYARPLIYSTMPAFPSLLAIRAAYAHLRERIPSAAAGGPLVPRANVRQARLRQLVQLFRAELAPFPAALLPSPSHIQGLLLPGRGRARAVADALRADGYDVRPIVPPTVPRGGERIRVCLHYHNPPEVVRALARRMAELLQREELMTAAAAAAAAAASRAKL
jgi:8-amino-7-oxononanoate synthase